MKYVGLSHEERGFGMTKEKSKLNAALIAGICFGVLALFTLINLFKYFHLLTLLTFCAYAVLAVVLLVKEIPHKALLTVCAAAIPALINIIDFFRGFKYLYKVEDYIYRVGWVEKFNPLCMLPMLAIVAAFLLLLAIALAYFAESIPQLEGQIPENLLQKLAQVRDLSKKLWFVPAVLLAASVVLPILYSLFSAIGIMGYWFNGRLFYNLNSILHIPAFLFAAMYWVYPEGLPASESSAEGVPACGDGYIGLVKHALLLTFTCGIWLLIWIYRTTRYLNRVEGEEYRNPTKKLLLCMFVPMYFIYWTYKSAQRVDILAEQAGVRSNLTTLCPVLSIMGGLLSMILMQDKINRIIVKESGYVAPATPSTAQDRARSYCGLVEHALLLTFTCGIWMLIWIYRTTRYLNCVEGEEYRNPTRKLLLCMFVPTYLFYWTYKTAQRVDVLAEQNGVRSNLTPVCTVLSIIGGFLPMIILQEKLNAISNK